MPTLGGPEREKEAITRESVVRAFRALKSKGIEDPDDFSNPKVKKAINLLDAFAEQGVKAAQKKGDQEAEARANLERTTILLDSGFDVSKNPGWIEERREWLVQDYDTAVQEGFPSLSQEILANIHRIDDALGEDRFNSADIEKVGPLPGAFLTLEEREIHLIDSIGERMNTLVNKLLESPEDAKTQKELKHLLSGDVVRALTNHYVSRGYRDEAEKRAHTFIKITDDIVIYGQGDMENFSFDKVQALTVEASRPLVNEMETNPKLVKEHE